MVLPALATAQSIQDIPPVTPTGPLRFSHTLIERGPILPAYGTRERDLWLRRYDRHEQNGIWRSARSGIIKKIVSSPWEIKAETKIHAPLSPYWGRYGYGRDIDEVEIYQSILQKAQLMEGWGSYISRTWRAFLSQDNGGWTYITGPGEPSGPLIGAVTGIEALDPLRCYATGNPEFPVLYYSLITNKLHKVHWTRTFRFVDSPDIEEAMYGHGECALSRAIAAALREIRMASYIDMWLDDKPKPGIHLWGGTSEKQYDTVLQNFLNKKNTDAGLPLGNVLNVFGLDPAVPVKMESVNFVEPPEKFDFIQYTSLDVNHIAAALNTDRQEIWELTGGNIGSGTQSEILHQKSRGKIIGLIFAETTRFVNTSLLPEYLDFSFRYRDDERDAAEAELNASYMDTAAKMKALTGIFNDAQIRYFLMSSSERIGEALSEESLQTQSQPPAPQTQQQSPQQPAIATDTQAPANPAQPLPEQQQPASLLKQKQGDERWRRFEVEELEIDNSESEVDATDSEAGDASLTSEEPSKTTKAGAFQESQHPREAAGKFTEKPGAQGSGSAAGRTSEDSPSRPKTAYRDFSSQSDDDIHTAFSAFVQPRDYLPNEHKAVGNYQLSSTEINNVARGKSADPSGKITKQIQDLDDALSKSKAPHDFVAYRGIPDKSGYGAEFAAAIKSGNIRKGTKLTDPGFASTTLQRKVVNNFAEGSGGIEFQINVKRGQPGLYMAGLTGKNDYLHEQEFLLPRNSQMKVRNIATTPDGRYIVQADLIPATKKKALLWHSKDYDATRSQFVNNVVDLVRGGNNDEMSRRRFGIVFRAQLRTLGQQAFTDGLRAGGVEGELDEEDLSQVRKWLADQSAYVSDFSEGLYKEGLTPEQIGQHADMWANKSLESIYQEGLVSADKNGLYQWVLGNTEEHCPDCKRLNGQVHRFKEYYSRGWVPKGDRLACHGYKCECELKRVPVGKAQGRF